MTTTTIFKFNGSILQKGNKFQKCLQIAYVGLAWFKVTFCHISIESAFKCGWNCVNTNKHPTCQITELNWALRSARLKRVCILICRPWRTVSSAPGVWALCCATGVNKETKGWRRPPGPALGGLWHTCLQARGGPLSSSVRQVGSVSK